MRVERGDPLVAVGGGALGDAAGFLAAIYLRGIRFIQVPTTLVAQIDSAIGGKTGVDLPEGKNLVGAFHQPARSWSTSRCLRTLPERQMRAALGEAVKMAALGDERLFELLETDGLAIARVDDGGLRRSGVLAELVERAGWAKVEVVVADERERGATGGRITLNLGHSLGPRLRGGRRLRRAAPRRGGRLRPARRVPDRRRGRGHAAGARGRIGALLDRLGPRDRAAPLPARRRSWTALPPTRSTPPAGCAGSSRPPTAS